MIEFINNFHFIRPYFLLFLLLPLFLFFRKMIPSKSSSSWEDICDKPLLNFLLVKGSAKKIFSIKKYIYIGLFFAIISAAGPAWKKVETPSFNTENPNMFVLSLSQDMQLKDIYPSRLERTKYVIHDITKALDNGQFGLMVYSSEPYVITPITDDIELIKNLLPEIVPNIVPDGGDRLDRAIDLAMQRFINAGYKKGNIILFATDVGQQFNSALTVVERAKNLNFSVNVIDVSFEGNEKLKLLAQKGGGEYSSVRKPIPQLFINKLKNVDLNNLKESKNTRSKYLDFGYYLIFIPMLCLLMFFRRGFVFVLFCFYSFSASASFLKNDNQEGLSLFNQKNYTEAYNKFTDINWRGISLYNQNKLEEALKEIEKDKSSLSLYNQGVILVKLCKYQEALDVFKKSLAVDPSNSDAKYNIDVLNTLFESAKKDPAVLNCENNQQQQNNNSPSSDKNNDDNSQSENKDDQSQDEQQNNTESSENENKTDNKEDNTSENNQTNTPKKENSDNNTDVNNTEENQNESTSNKKENGNNNERDMDNANYNENTSKETSTQKQQKDFENGGKNKDEANYNDKLEESGEEQNQSASELKKANNNEDYDEEALALQRRYREIPEDTGGLLREFIKKDYMRNRYND